MANTARIAWLCSVATVATAMMGVAQAAAQTARPAGSSSQAAGAAPAPDPATQDADDIVVTGFRESLEKAINLKRSSGVMLDAISADDIASFPEANVAESLQRIPGVSIDRDNGEGRQISVRGLGGDFTRVRINGLEALSTTGTLNAGQSTPNTSRSFDFNTFASELFNQASVRKTASAETDEGSLGATVDLNTARPFGFKGQRIAFAAAEAYYTNGDRHSPRITGLYSNRFFGDKVGLLLSGAYQNRNVLVSNYKRSTGQGDLLYRGMTWAGNETPPRAGFAAPTGTDLSRFVNTSGTGAVGSANRPCPGGNGAACNIILNPDVNSALTGSDPAAYAALFPAGFSNAPSRYDDSTVIIPSLPGLVRQNLKTERIGLTGSLQFQISERSLLTFDGLYSRFKQTGDVSGIEPVGLGRNNTDAGLYALRTGTSADVRRALYPNGCVAVAETDVRPGQDCGGTTLVPGYAYSFNPNNLDVFEYYTNPRSPGYQASAFGIGGLLPLIGRPSTKVLAANVTNGVADYLELSNLDWRSYASRTSYDTEFQQASVNLDHEFSDTLKARFGLGYSRSVTDTQLTLVEFNAMDRPERYVYDSRDGGDMPVFTPGFDVSDAANWGIVKGFSVMRNNLNTVENTFKQGSADLTWEMNDQFTILFGGSYKRYDFDTTAAARNLDAINPTEKEAGVTAASLGQRHAFGEGLKLADGTPATYFAPNIDAFSNTFGFDCDCVNKFGDFRTTALRATTVGANFQIKEEDTAGYVQANFRGDILGRPLSGNFGLRVVETKIGAVGRSTVGRVIDDSNRYVDFLPALNLSYEAVDDLLIRFGASSAMARPTLANLSPSITQLSVPTAVNALVGGTLSVGNTRLKPFRSANLDLAMEWYFRPNSVISVAIFNKDVSSFPQTVISEALLSDILSPEEIAGLIAQQTNVNQVEYLTANRPFAVRQVRDAPGGYLRGVEVNIQSDFWFLPGILKNFGFQLNGTKIKSSLTYILDPGTFVNGVQSVPATFGRGPWLNASPEAINFTFYYQDKKLNARTSLAWRSDYATNYPIQAGSCAAGSAPGATLTTAPCNSPLINDFVNARGTMNIDAVINYNVTDFLTIRLEGLNLTNQPDQRFAYSGNPQVTNYGSSGTQFTLGARLRF